MVLWQVDFYRRPLQSDRGEPLWELVIREPVSNFTHVDRVPQSEAIASWLVDRLQKAAPTLPDRLQVFRPQCLSLLETAGKQLGIPVEATRRTLSLKKVLRDRAIAYLEMPEFSGETYDPVALEKPPPLPLPEEVRGDRWQFASVSAGDLLLLTERPIPVKFAPEFLFPVRLGLASTQVISGVVIYGGRRSMQLARWLEAAQPVSLNYIPAQTDGLVLGIGLVDRIIMATFDDPEVKAAARTYQKQQQQAKGLHFLLVQPDDSGMTYSGFWLLQPA